MKKVGLILLCVLLMVALAVPAFAAGEMVFTLTPDKTSVAKGEEVTFTVTVSGGNAFKKFGANVIFDKALFEATDEIDETKNLCEVPGASMALYSDKSGFAVIMRKDTAYEGTIGYFTLRAVADCPNVGSVTLRPAVQNAAGEAITTTVSTVNITISGEHAYGDWAKVDEDNHARTCADCGDVETVAHTWVDGEITKAPSCKEEGAQAVACECGATKTKVLPMTEDHTEVVLPAKAPTCTETGLTEGKQCSVCEKILVEQEVVEAKGHNEVVVPGKAATCTEAGLTEGKKCSVCGEILVAQEEIAAKGHIDEVLPAKEATCTATGLTEGKKCSVCGEILVAQEEIAMKPHTEEVIPAKAVTCTENGLTEGKKCSVCGEILVAQEVIVAEGHKDADANEFCDICGEDLSCKHPNTEVLPAKAATCTETGLTEGKKCSDCGDILVKQEIVPIVPHEFAETWKADETNHWHECVCGEKADVAEHVFTEGDLCDFCKFERDHVHRLIAVEAAEATCEKAGNKAHYACSGCEEWFEDAQGAVKITDKSLFIIEKLPHTDADNDQFCDDCKADLRPPVVPEEPKDDEFKTGDSTNVMLWSALLALSAMGAVACVITSKKKYNA